MKKTFRELLDEGSRFIKVPMIVGALVIAAGVLATYAFADFLATRAADDFQQSTEEQITIFAGNIEARTTEFEQILLLLAAYRRSMPEVSQASWSGFIDESQVIARHPFILGIGYVDAVPPDQLQQYIQNRQEKRPGFQITPEGQRDFYTAIRYLEPANEVNERAIGFDMFSESTRRQAMAKARDEAKASMTTPVELVQDEGDANQQGVLVYYPIYAAPTPPESIPERREQLRGFTYIVFRPSDLIRYIEQTEGSDQLRSSSFVVSDTSTGKIMANQVYTPAARETQYDAARQSTIIDKQWSVALSSYQPALQRFTAPGVTFLLGIATSFAIGGSVAYLMTRRLIRLDAQHQTELQRTKDELLALTSHQLRTPASGVKQYIGMLLQGFVGQLSPEQEIIAKKAFAANERQLETINQLLHVAKADADQLVLQKEVLDLTLLTEQVIDSMHDDVEDHQAEIIVKAPKKKPVLVHADERYVRMVLENLLSNALKYSEEGTAITVTVCARKEVALLSVRDRGVGIEEADIERLFKKFSRIPNEFSKTVGGSGLGLFLAQQIMVAHGGDIEVDSKPGRGSIFTLTLPTAPTSLVNKEKA